MKQTIMSDKVTSVDRKREFKLKRDDIASKNEYRRYEDINTRSRRWLWLVLVCAHLLITAAGGVALLTSLSDDLSDGMWWAGYVIVSMIVLLACWAGEAAWRCKVGNMK